jgi:ubiquinone/menaquinone biosynthesis C-methylase UbiE
MGCAYVGTYAERPTFRPTRNAGLREVRRVLLSGGRLIAMERRAEPGAQGHQSHGWTDEQATVFADRCRERGFSDVCLERATIGRRSTVSVVARAL